LPRTLRVRPHVGTVSQAPDRGTQEQLELTPEYNPHKLRMLGFSVDAKVLYPLDALS
jgi:hypothetical protein